MDSHRQAIQEEEKWFSTKLGLEMGPLFVWLQLTSLFHHSGEMAGMI